MTKYFTYIPPLSVSERTLKINDKTNSKKNKPLDKSYRGKKTTQEYKWKNSWSAQPKLFNYKHNTKLVKNRFKRNPTYNEKLSVAIYKMTSSIFKDPMRMRWIKIKDKCLKTEYGLNNIIDMVISKFSRIYNKDDLMWVGAKYSPSLL